MPAGLMVIYSIRRKSIRDAAALAYERVVEHARVQVFFTGYGIPDTLDGRFELICLHAFLYLYRLKSERPQSAALSQAFFDAMFADLDRALREMGTGDLSVGKHVKRMAKGFYGRIRAYQDGVESTDSALAAALGRNLFGTVRRSSPQIAEIAEYVRAAVGELALQRSAELLSGRVHFPVPGIGEPSAAFAPSDAAR
jgi:cytochrome b pre-mRNA-processing protein 3